LYLSVRRGIKQIIVITGDITFANYVKNFNQHPVVNVNSICREYYLRSLMWILMQRSTTDHIFCIHQMLEKKWEYNEAVHQLFKDFKKACDSVKKEACIIFSLSLVSP
jgi:hypothetical protein